MPAVNVRRDAFEGKGRFRSALAGQGGAGAPRSAHRSADRRTMNAGRCDGKEGDAMSARIFPDDILFFEDDSEPREKVPAQ